jgi:hypothetical protein
VVDDGTSYRHLMVTLTTTTAGEQWVREHVGGAVADRLGTTFAFAMVANQTELVLVPVSHPTAWDALGVELVMTPRDHSRAQAVPTTTPYSKVAADMGGISDQCSDVSRQRHQLIFAEVNERYEDAQSRARSAGLLSGLPPALVIMDIGSVLSTTRFWWPNARYLDGLEQHMPPILTAQRLATSRWLRASEADRRAVLQRLDRCR